MKLKRILLLILLPVFVTGCSWFGGDDKQEEIKPNPLPSYKQEVAVTAVWSRSIGKGAGDRAIRLKPAVSGGRIYAAAADGHVKALATDSGRPVWEVQVKRFYSKAELANGFSEDLDTITGGVGVGGDLVVVGTGSGDIVAMNQSDGSFAWKSKASSEVLAPPQIDGDLVVVQSIDGKVTAYDAVDGSQRWVYTTNTPSLTLRGTATPALLDDIVIAAFSNGRVAFLDRERGLAAYDQRIAVSQGTTDLERLVDIDGALAIDDGKLFVASFQGRLVAIEIASGRMIWAEETSSVEGVGSGFGNVYLATADSQLVAFNGDNGREIWRDDSLLHRDITAPASIASYLVFTDFDGYLHVLAQSDGRIVGRRKIGSSVKSGTLVAGGRVYALGDSGTLTAMEIR